MDFDEIVVDFRRIANFACQSVSQHLVPEPCGFVAAVVGLAEIGQTFDGESESLSHSPKINQLRVVLPTHRFGQLLPSFLLLFFNINRYLWLECRETLPSSKIWNSFCVYGLRKKKRNAWKSWSTRCESGICDLTSNFHINVLTLVGQEANNICRVWVAWPTSNDLTTEDGSLLAIVGRFWDIEYDNWESKQHINNGAKIWI